MTPLGLYLHVPFCASKCPYCDFYSTRATQEEMERYTSAMEQALSVYRVDRPADTLYFGGGTPSLLGGARLTRLVRAAQREFGLRGAEVTVECNPASADDTLFSALAAAGVNRISLGMQSAVDTERRALGRRSSAVDVERAVQQAREAGIENVSLDFMLGVPGQTERTLQATLDFLISLKVPHVSAYLLKLEEGTLFYRRRESLALPPEDAVCDFYLQTVERLAQAGLRQYEISNFALPGRESRHNLKYWRNDPYLGLGPSAHSFLNGKRFYFTPSLEDFMNASEPVPDGEGGDFQEFAMLRLRLREGLTEGAMQERFGCAIPNELRECASSMADLGLIRMDDKGISLTPKGFLLSNTIIGKLLLSMEG